jgi:hypothetical protein
MICRDNNDTAFCEKLNDRRLEQCREILHNIPFSSLSFPSWDRRRIDREDKEYNRVVRMGGNIYMIEYSH